jgi:hypothetical protein
MYSEHFHQYLPPGFEIAKYHKTSNMALELWLINILIKLVGYKAYEAQADLSSISATEFENLMASLELLIDKALITDLDEQFSLLSIDLIKMDKAKYTSQVRELTYYDLFSLADELKSKSIGQVYEEKKNALNPRLAIILQNRLQELNEHVSLDNLFWSNTSSALLSVDLDCSNGEIKAAFNDWLKEKRQQQSLTTSEKRRSYKLNNFNMTTFRKWHDARVLAYMDLVAWNYAKGNKITSKIIGDILFPEYRNNKNTTDTVDDTVKPLVAKLSSITTIKRMIKAFVNINRKKII